MKKRFIFVILSFILICLIIQLSTAIPVHATKNDVIQSINFVAKWYNSHYGYDYIYSRQLMVEVGNQESFLGTHPNTYKNINVSTGVGDYGWAQFHSGGGNFKYVQDKLKNSINNPNDPNHDARLARVSAIKNDKRLGFNITTITISQLNNDPKADLMSAVMFREFMILREDSSASTLWNTLEKRANWWKDKWNTIEGKGTVEQYLNNNRALDKNSKIWSYSGENEYGSYYASDDDININGMFISDEEVCSYSVYDNLDSTFSNQCNFPRDLTNDKGQVIAHDVTGRAGDIVYFSYYNDLDSNGNYVPSMIVKRGSELALDQKIYSSFDGKEISIIRDGELKVVFGDNLITRTFFNDGISITSTETVDLSTKQTTSKNTPNRETDYTYFGSNIETVKSTFTDLDGLDYESNLKLTYDSENLNVLQDSNPYGGENIHSYAQLDMDCASPAEANCVIYGETSRSTNSYSASFVRDPNDPLTLISSCSNFDLTCVLDKSSETETETEKISTDSYENRYVRSSNGELIRFCPQGDLNDCFEISYDGPTRTVLYSEGDKEKDYCNPASNLDRSSLAFCDIVKVDYTPAAGQSTVTGSVIKDFINGFAIKITGKAIFGAEDNSITYYLTSPGDTGSALTKDQLLSLKSSLVKTYTQNVCGNNVLESENNEECDDGNTADNDGCSSKCILEFNSSGGDVGSNVYCSDVESLIINESNSLTISGSLDANKDKIIKLIEDTKKDANYDKFINDKVGFNCPPTGLTINDCKIKNEVSIVNEYLPENSVCGALNKGTFEITVDSKEILKESAAKASSALNNLLNNVVCDPGCEKKVSLGVNDVSENKFIFNYEVGCISLNNNIWNVKTKIYGQKSCVNI